MYVFEHPGGNNPFYTFTYWLSTYANHTSTSDEYRQYVPKVVLEIFTSNNNNDNSRQYCNRSACNGEILVKRNRVLLPRPDSNKDNDLFQMNRSYNQLITKTKSPSTLEGNTLTRGHLAYNNAHNSDCSACVEQNLLPQRSYHNHGNWLTIEENLDTFIRKHTKHNKHNKHNKFVILSGGLYTSEITKPFNHPAESFLDNTKPFGTNKSDSPETPTNIPSSFFKYIGFSSKTLKNEFINIPDVAGIVNHPDYQYDNANQYYPPFLVPSAGPSSNTSDNPWASWGWIFMKFPHSTYKPESYTFVDENHKRDNNRTEHHHPKLIIQKHQEEREEAILECIAKSNMQPTAEERRKARLECNAKPDTLFLKKTNTSEPYKKFTSKSFYDFKNDFKNSNSPFEICYYPTKPKPKSEPKKRLVWGMETTGGTQTLRRRRKKNTKRHHKEID